MTSSHEQKTQIARTKRKIVEIANTIVKEFYETNCDYSSYFDPFNDLHITAWANIAARNSLGEEAEESGKGFFASPEELVDPGIYYLEQLVDETEIACNRKYRKLFERAIELATERLGKDVTNKFLEILQEASVQGEDLEFFTIQALLYELQVSYRE